MVRKGDFECDMVPDETLQIIRILEGLWSGGDSLMVHEIFSSHP